MPADADGIRMSTIGNCGTACLVYSNGASHQTAYYASPGDTCGTSGYLLTSTINGAPAYGVSGCNRRVLIRVSYLSC